MEHGRNRRGGQQTGREKITGNRQLVMEGTAIGSPVNGEIRKISQDTLQDTTEEAADDNTKCITICRRMEESMLPLREKC